MKRVFYSGQYGVKRGTGPFADAWAGVAWAAWAARASDAFNRFEMENGTGAKRPQLPSE